MEVSSFGEFLVKSGTLSRSALSRACAAEGTTDASFARLISDLGLVGQDELKKGFLTHFKLEECSVKDFPDVALNVNLNPSFLKTFTILPIKVEDGIIIFAMADPTQQWALDALNFSLSADYKIMIAEAADIDAAIMHLYFAEDVDAQDVLFALEDDIARLHELASDAPVIRYVDRLIDEAVGLNASDIHLEPIEQGLTVRLRIDGRLSSYPSPSIGTEAAVLSRFKILASLDIAERRLPQDGRMRQTVRGRNMDFRVSTSPTLRGESIVLRILDRMMLPLDLAELGFRENLRHVVSEALSKPEGIVLVTGPTGSGKTTTLYAGLRTRHKPDVKILTVEDPVEYTLDGINQVAVEPKIGRTFASTLRSFLRQDPDIIMVGEIRDKETAEIAAQASQTGHLVLSTLHTNDAAGAFARLKDMGVPSYLIAPTITAIVGQRLVRLLCERCKVPTTLLVSQLKQFGLQNQKPIKGYEATGCDICRKTGYVGRTVIAEILLMDDAMRTFIMSDVPSHEIKRHAQAQGMVTMFEDGLRLIKEGRTSLTEVIRVTRTG